MKLGTSNYYITFKKQGTELWSNLYREWSIVTDPIEKENITNLYKIFTKRSADESVKMEALAKFLEANSINVKPETQAIINRLSVQTTIQSIIDFSRSLSLNLTSVSSIHSHMPATHLQLMQRATWLTTLNSLIVRMSIR